ncbi:MAG: SDR family NAD(P)-dependent oxidoreductase [Chloroflexi bacterium]|nr:SDR family NAD(P)-dependent oxidoreductase [Chloroflexota bacterium]
MAKVLITGGAGFIGLHLARSLVEQGQTVTLWDNLSRGDRDSELKTLLARPNTSLVVLDMADAAQVRAQSGTYDVVYHLAAVNGTRFFYDVPDRVMRVNLLAQIHLLDWLVERGCGRLLFSSSSEGYAGTTRAYGVPIPTPEDVPLVIEDPAHPRASYAASKIAGEVLLHSYARVHSLPISIVRYHNVYGPRMGTEHVIPEFCFRLRQREDPFIINGAKNTRAFCYVTDAVRATQLVAETREAAGGTFNVGNSLEEVTIKDLALRLFDIANFHPAIREGKAPAGSVDRRCPDTHRLQQLTGYTPSVSLAIGLRETYKWYATRSLSPSQSAAR